MFFSNFVTVPVPCAAIAVVFEIFDFKNVVTLKTGLGVRQGHWRYHRSIEPMRLPIE